MKRFVTYLYECERGDRIRNVGFVRVNVRDNETTMEVYIRNFPRASGVGNLYALVYKEEMKSVSLGEVRIERGQCDSRIAFKTEDILESGYGINDIVGLGIRFEESKYVSSCWKDEYASEVARGEFIVEEPLIESKETLVVAEKLKDQAEDIVYEKIDLSQIRDLPSPNWHLATNSFLVHGFWNYGYLVLKKELEENKEKLSLGVPGIFEKPEAVMAILFGFPDFEVLTQELVVLEKEKNQETEAGTFGCWFVRLKV